MPPYYNPQNPNKTKKHVSTCTFARPCETLGCAIVIYNFLFYLLTPWYRSAVPKWSADQMLEADTASSRPWATYENFLAPLAISSTLKRQNI